LGGNKGCFQELLEEKQEAGGMETEPEFNKFWEFYPKKKSKGDAYRAWLQTKHKRPELSQILKAIVVLRESNDWLKDGGQYVPYPATWIRAWGWADVPEEEKQDVRGDTLWWKTVSGIEAKAKELGLEWDALHGETFQKFAERVKSVARENKVTQLVKSS
jgi:hypothetical protein